MVSHIRDYQHIIIDTEGNPTDDDFKDLASNCDLLVIPAVPESVATDGLTHPRQASKPRKQDPSGVVNDGAAQATQGRPAATRHADRRTHSSIYR
jgi:cellulose biosynthesis protein BcsQ